MSAVLFKKEKVQIEILRVSYSKDSMSELFQLETINDIWEVQESKDILLNLKTWEIRTAQF